MALTHNPNSDPTAAPREVLVASPHLVGTVYDRKVALIVEGGRQGFRGVVVNAAFRKSILAARKSLQSKPLSRLSEPEPIALGMIQWAPGKLEEEIRSGVWMPTATTMQAVLASEDDLWANLLRGIGRSVLQESLGIKHFPKDVHAN